MEKAKEIRTPDGHLVGLFRGGVLKKIAKKSKHLFKRHGGNGSWGIDYDILYSKELERASVYIEEQEDHILYMARVSQWKEYGHIMHFNDGDIDHYTQVFLPVEYFNRVRLQPVRPAR